VRSKLEYGAVIWNPVYNKYVIQLENIQRRLVRFLAFKSAEVFPPRGIEQYIFLLRFKIPLLLNRRQYLLVQFLYKMCRSLIDCPVLLSQVNFHVLSRTVRSSPMFHLPTPSTNFLIKTPLFQSMSIMNDIDVFGLSPI